MQTSSPGTKQPATREDTAKIKQTLRKILKHIDSHISILCSTEETFQSPKPSHIILCTVPTVMEACSPSPETVKALDVTSFTVNLFSTDEILALQSKATSAKNFAVLSVQHDCVQAF